MPRTKPADERRTELLDAGQAVFVEKGITTATLDDITRRAGVAKGTFYLYFRSKEELVGALQARYADRFAKRMSAAITRARSWPGKLDACVDACFDSYAEEYALHEVLFHHPAPQATPHPAEPARNVVVDTIASLLRAGTEAGSYQVADVELTAALLYGAMHGAYDGTLHANGEPNTKALVRAARSLFRRAAGVR